jgi:hypothetical protein
MKNDPQYLCRCRLGRAGANRKSSATKTACRRISPNVEAVGFSAIERIPSVVLIRVDTRLTHAGYPSCHPLVVITHRRRSRPVRASSRHVLPRLWAGNGCVDATKSWKPASNQASPALFLIAHHYCEKTERAKGGGEGEIRRSWRPRNCEKGVKRISGDKYSTRSFVAGCPDNCLH